jgi:hypothetical protein
MHKLIALAPLLVAACSTVSASKNLASQEQASGGDCRSEGLEGFAGREASAEVGTEILAKTGAKVLRWLKPGQIVTMEYRSDRVNAHLDSSNKIERVNCG